MITCPACSVPFPSGASNCPHCGAAIIPDRICPSCRHPSKNPEETYCIKCGSSLDRDDSTIPVELGGSSSGWTSQLVNEVIEKALEAGRYQQAASLLQGKIEDYERKSKRGVTDVGRLVDISGFNLELARAQRDPKRARWVLKQWTSAAVPMPRTTLDALVRAGGDLVDLTKELGSYLAALEARKSYSEADEPLMERLRGLVQEEGHR
jgi:hypothetical protein